MDKNKPLPEKSNISEDENKIDSGSGLEEKEVNEVSKNVEKDRNDPSYLCWRRREKSETPNPSSVERKKDYTDSFVPNWRRKEKNENVKHSCEERKSEYNDQSLPSWRRKGATETAKHYNKGGKKGYNDQPNSSWRINEGEKRNSNKEGYWSFLVDIDIKNSVMDILKNLHEKDPNLFIKPPIELGYKKEKLATIGCPTPDFEDTENVRNVAKKIRESFYHPYLLFYFHDNKVRYKYAMQDLYSDVGFNFRKVINEEASSSITNMVREISLEEELDPPTRLPSNEFYHSILVYPPSYNVEDSFHSQGGKWMLYGSGDLEKIDFFWKRLVRLCDEGVLIAVKSSTAADNRKGVVRGYTKDSENVKEVKRAGDAIVKVTGFDEIMYYKTNEASVEGLYREEGHKNISLYFHAGENELYIRDEYQWWKLYEELDEC